MSYEVLQPIRNSPCEEPRWHWWIEEGRRCEKREGRRPLVYFIPATARRDWRRRGTEACKAIQFKLVNLMRKRVKV